MKNENNFDLQQFGFALIGPLGYAICLRKTRLSMLGRC
jgi:hypothetical protein